MVKRLEILYAQLVDKSLILIRLLPRGDVQRTDDIVINCGNAIISNNDAFDVFSSINGDSNVRETLATNILYNLCLQFTDVLDLIFIDSSNV
jgi:hypothetical protein